MPVAEPSSDEGDAASSEDPNRKAPQSIGYYKAAEAPTTFKKSGLNEYVQQLKKKESKPGLEPIRASSSDAACAAREKERELAEHGAHADGTTNGVSVDAIPDAATPAVVISQQPSPFGAAVPAGMASGAGDEVCLEYN